MHSNCYRDIVLSQTVHPRAFTVPRPASRCLGHCVATRTASDCRAGKSGRWIGTCQHADGGAPIPPPSAILNSAYTDSRPPQAASASAEASPTPKELLQDMRTTLEQLSMDSDFDDDVYWSGSYDAEHVGHLTGTAAAAVGRAVYEMFNRDDDMCGTHPALDKHVWQQTQMRQTSATGHAKTIGASGHTHKIYVKRRDLLRAYGLAPRDLRRLESSDQNADILSVKGSCLLVKTCGVRIIVTAERAFVFDPDSTAASKFLQIVIPRLKASAGTRVTQQQFQQPEGTTERSDTLPFELEVVEAALTLGTGRLDAELMAVTRRMQVVLKQLPNDVNPVNLEELRRVKQALNVLEGRADSFKLMLEEIMDDEDELGELNLSSRPQREERRKQRERDRLEREMEREQQQRWGREQQHLKGQVAGRDGAAASRAESPDAAPEAASDTVSWDGGHAAPLSESMHNNAGVPLQGPAGFPCTCSDGGSGSGERAHRRWLRASDQQITVPPPRNPRPLLSGRPPELAAQPHPSPCFTGGGAAGYAAAASFNTYPHSHPLSGIEDGSSDTELLEAAEQLEEMDEQEEEERELEEVEDMLEYYLQRAAATQNEAERLLQGARDLEESIGVSLSAKRFAVNRLELELSIGSFAAALGAMIAGIFGMNLQSTLESSVIGFWGMTLAIIALCVWVYFAILIWTRKRRIL